MNIYVDFEANAVTQEIISIGAVSEDGREFYSLVRPHTKLDHMIKELTGITQENADAAPSIEEVIADFSAWVNDEKPNFVVFGNSDRDFINGSLAFVEDVNIRQYLNFMWNRIDNVAKRVAKKFYRDTIGLRSAYLTMRLAFDEPATQDHNALNDAAMLKWVWENIENYILPEGVVPIKVKKPNMRYSKKKNKESQLISKDRIYDYPAKDEHYYIPIKIIGKNCKGIDKEWCFDNIPAGLMVVHIKKFRNKQRKLVWMDKMLHAIETGEPIEWKYPGGVRNFYIIKNI